MRDSLLAVSGALDPTIGGPAVAITEPPFSARRTVYGFIDRQNLDGLYRTFDFAVPDATSPRRFVTTVPQQALFLMNSPFLHEQTRRLTELIDVEPVSPASLALAGSAADLAEGVRRLYRHVLGRSPEADELCLGIDFVRRQAGIHANKLGAWRRPTRPGADRLLSPWEQLGQVLLLTNEFMFVD